MLHGDPNRKIRLSEYPKGRVELYRNGQWGTLCGHYWWDNQRGAENICNQLGYSEGTKYTAPGGSGPIQTGNRLCNGGETDILDCPLRRGELTGCTHDHDQGVHCTGDRDLSKLECGADKPTPRQLNMTQCSGLRLCVKG